jgi:hypothetical protein
MEGGEYGFQVELGIPDHPLEMEPSSELLSFDDATCRRGRLYPHQFVGRVRFRITQRDPDLTGWAEVEVRPAKLEAETEYRRMLRDIEDVATEALLQGFAPSSLTMGVDPDRSAQLLYQQFALLHAKLTSAEFSVSMALVLANPHRGWLVENEAQHPGRPLPGRGQLVRSLARSGPRIETGGKLSVPSVPRTVERLRTDSTFDSLPNQFVKYALARWRGIAQQLADLLDARGAVPGSVRRGRDAAAELLSCIDGYLSTPLFRDVSRLQQFPTANQVLLKQAGYREVFRTFALGELGGRVALDLDIDDPFAASQRNVAALYEYWAFLRLADAVGRVCGANKSVRALRPSNDGLSWGFVQGADSALKWAPEHRGRQFHVQLFFNRTFVASAELSSDTSWSRSMRPDCSLRLRPRSRIPRLTDPKDLDVWLHFDAKYRVENERAQFDASLELDPTQAEEAEVTERLSRSRREDLLKMHAYRDAIRRSAGAYVLFPGNTPTPPFRKFGEVVPGLGAFVLRPGATRENTGTSELEHFIRALLDHAADRASQYERERYWSARIRRTQEPTSEDVSDLPQIDLPPRDALVLCGFIRNAAHAAWVETTRLYNVRADRRRGALSPDSTELQPDWLVLYRATHEPTLWRRSGAWFVQSREQLKQLGYPEPRGSAYLCCPVGPEVEGPAWLSTVDLNALRPTGLAVGHPYATNWASLLAARRV